MKVTPAMRVLEQQKIPHDLRSYAHEVKGAEYAAEALDWPLEAMVKTLVVSLADGRFVLCLLPGDRELSLKKLARHARVKSARLTTVAEAEKLTGYRVGGISPFGTRKRLPVFAHQSLPSLSRIGLNAGRRGCIAFLSPHEALRVLGAEVADLAGARSTERPRRLESPPGGCDDAGP